MKQAGLPLLATLVIVAAWYSWNNTPPDWHPVPKGEPRVYLIRPAHCSVYLDARRRVEACVNNMDSTDVIITEQ